LNLSNFEPIFFYLLNLSRFIDGILNYIIILDFISEIQDLLSMKCLKKVSSLIFLLFILLFTFFPVKADQEICPELIPGGPPKDGIPAIDNPKFLSSDQFEREHSEEYLNSIIILGITINGEARAYPIDILNWHEIVNDNFEGKPISITYCPLTGSGIAFNTSSISGSSLGTTGQLYENNLIFYDRITETYWSQMFGLSWCGQLKGPLEMAPIIEATWISWKSMYPESKVLSRETGYTKDYDRSPYGQYSNTESILFRSSYLFHVPPYTLFHPKEITHVLTLGNQTYLFPHSELTKYPVLNIYQKETKFVVIFDFNSHLAIAYNTTLSNGTNLRFSTAYSDKNKKITQIVQDESGTIWNIKGEAIEGELLGEKLDLLLGFNAYWFAATVFFGGAKTFVNNSFIYNYSGEIEYISEPFDNTTNKPSSDPKVSWSGKNPNSAENTVNSSSFAIAFTSWKDE
jgi:hypothetical protein